MNYCSTTLNIYKCKYLRNILSPLLMYSLGDGFPLSSRPDVISCHWYKGPNFSNKAFTPGMKQTVVLFGPWEILHLSF